MSRRNYATFLAGLIFSVTLLAYPTTATPLPPVAAFTYTPTAPILGDIVVFDASDSYDPNGGTILSYRWDFDDGTVITVDVPTAHHNYTTFGTYNVTLTVTDDEAETDTTWRTVTVREYPVAYFTYSPTVPIAGETATFNASLSTPNGGTITSYTWDFGDGNITVAGAVITHTYTAPGNYTATLNVTDSEGLWDTESKSITIIGFPQAEFAYTPERPIVGDTVTFNASLSTPNGGTITSYTWDFGDGNITVAGAVITHAYTAEGTYNVTLTVTDDEGLTDTVWKLVTVYTFLYVHDVAITNVTISATEVYVERTVNITVVAKNVGTAVETFNVTVYWNATSAGTQTVTNLLPDEETTVTFSWDTTGVTPGIYLISVKISSLVLGEIEMDDGYVKVKRTGDVNGDGATNVIDIILCCSNMGPVTPANIQCDINDDGQVNVIDVILCCINMG